MVVLRWSVVVAGLVVLAWVTGARGSGESAATTAQAPLQGKLVDLSHAFDRRTVCWPTAKRFKLTKVAEGETEAGYFYAANDYEGAEHCGTHLDAPIHFSRGGDASDEIPLRRLTGRGVVVDVRRPAGADRDYQVKVSDFEAWEQRHGRIARGTLVLLRTGYGRYWPDRERYMGTAERGAKAVPKLHFPGLDPAAARWLIAERRIKAVGIDTPSIDYGQSTLFESHRALGAAQTPIFENVANVDRLPAEGFTVVALPMKIGGGSGGPLRIMAAVDR